PLPKRIVYKHWATFVAVATAVTRNPGDAAARTQFASFPETLALWENIRTSAKARELTAVGKALSRTGRLREARAWLERAAAAEEKSGVLGHDNNWPFILISVVLWHFYYWPVVFLGALAWNAVTLYAIYFIWKIWGLEFLPRMALWHVVN